MLFRSQKLNGGLSIKTVKDILIVLKMVMKFGVKNEWINMPAGAKPGDVLESEGGAYIPAPEETEKRRAYARRLEEMLRHPPA